ncbi:MAG: glycosyltransferase family 4 protein [Bellilinea sp.]
MTSIPVRLGIQQRVFPVYRAPFFEALGRACPQGFSLFAGSPRPKEAIASQTSLQHGTLRSAKNLHFLGGSGYFLWQRGIMPWLEEWQPEALVMEANPRYLSSMRAVRWMHERNRPVIGWGLGAPKSSGWQGRSWQRFLNRFDALIAYSWQGAEEYARTGFDHQRIFVAINAVTPRPTRPPPERPPMADTRQVIVLYVGRLQPRKRVDLLLRACAALPVAMQPQVWIVGDGPVRHELEVLADSAYPSARFWGARYDHELEELFQAADLFVLPGTGGLAVQQAMSYGLPVIVAEADGTQSDLVRPENGWLLPGSDLAALTGALYKALSEPSRLREMGKASFQLVDAINLEAMVDSFSRAVAAAVAYRSS